MVEKWDHYPVYMWAGPGTIRINKVKFPGKSIDEQVHIKGGLREGAARLKKMGYNWAYCSYNWGFPPEIEKEDHEYFRKTVEEYHAQGLKVFGYVQFSNAVFTGSYLTKRWYALDPYGEKINYYSGRYLVCPTDPEWKEHLKEIVIGIVNAGADGVFFDNMFGSWFGFRPCYCDRCQDLFKEFAEKQGFDVKGIPHHLSENIESRLYLIWRRKIIWQTVEELSEVARKLKKDILISSNSFEAGISELSIMAGIDLREAFRVQDLVMIENHQIPRKFHDIQIFNTMTYRIAHAHSKGKAVTSVPYMFGIGDDSVYPVRLYLQAMAEAYSNDSVMVLKGTEYFHNGKWTLLTDDQFEDVRNQIENYHKWYKQNLVKDLYGERAARIGIFHPYDSLTFHWEKTALPFFAAQHELIRSNIDYKVVWDNFEGVDLLLVPPIFEENEINIVKKFKKNKIFLGYSPFENEKLIWSDVYKIISLNQKPEQQLALEQDLALLNFSTYFNDQVWRERLQKNGFLFFNYLNYCYTFTHPFNAEELIEIVENYQDWKIKSDGFVITTSYKQDNLLKVHVVNLEERKTEIDLVLPQGFELKEVCEYSCDGVFVHRIYFIST
ncbi:DUF6259 domain-containing protein [Thermotoga profunda]|uniref:DUF6259 domain-containing protein n=1 Tax=Thermotoga profunda TaxID=1508420 RepID=UPI000AF273D7|nr:DUF6259 domain-containing protein [Thermotoga profunda]